MNVRTTNQYTVVGYNPVGKSKEDGFHCLTLVTDWMKNILGSSLEYKDSIVDDITWDNVNELFEKDPVGTYERVEAALLEFGYIIPLKDITKGDIVAVKVMGSNRVIPAVFVGGNKIMLATLKGVRVLNLNKVKLIKAYRAYET